MQSWCGAEEGVEVTVGREGSGVEVAVGEEDGRQVIYITTVRAGE